MNKLENYINGHWVKGEGDGTPMFDAVTGETIGFSTTAGFFQIKASPVWNPHQRF